MTPTNSHKHEHPLTETILAISFFYFVMIIIIWIPFSMGATILSVVVGAIIIAWTLITIYFVDKSGRKSGFKNMEDMLGTFMIILFIGPALIPFALMEAGSLLLEKIEPNETPPAPKRYRREKEEVSDKDE